MFSKFHNLFEVFANFANINDKCPGWTSKECPLSKLSIDLSQIRREQDNGSDNGIRITGMKVVVVSLLLVLHSTHW